jgi:hypothetical protein
LVPASELVIGFREPVIGFREPAVGFAEPIIGFLEPVIGSASATTGSASFCFGFEENLVFFTPEPVGVVKFSHFGVKTTALRWRSRSTAKV